jgi:hypothetical protein
MSSTKRVIMPFKAVDAGDMAGNITGKESNTASLDFACYFVSWTGTSPVGVLKFEALELEDGTWTQIDFGSTIAISGNTGSHQVVFNSMPFAKIRPVYTRTSGIGTLTINAIMKEG